MTTKTNTREPWALFKATKRKPKKMSEAVERNRIIRENDFMVPEIKPDATLVLRNG